MKEGGLGASKEGRRGIGSWRVWMVSSMDVGKVQKREEVNEDRKMVQGAGKQMIRHIDTCGRLKGRDCVAGQRHFNLPGAAG